MPWSPELVTPDMPPRRGWFAGQHAKAVIPVATATAAGNVPVVAASAFLTAPVAAATADTLTPGVGLSSPVTAPVAAATAAALVPVVAHGSTIAAPVAAATADTLVPAAAYGSTVVAPLATSTADGLVPVVGGGSGVTAPVAAATADTLTPGVGLSAAITAPVAAATADALAPAISAGAGVTAPVAAATADTLTPTVSVTSSPPQTVALTGIPSSAAVGAPTVSVSTVNVALTGIPSSAAVGAPTITVGGVTVSGVSANYASTDFSEVRSSGPQESGDPVSISGGQLTLLSTTNYTNYAWLSIDMRGKAIHTAMTQNITQGVGEESEVGLAVWVAGSPTSDQLRFVTDGVGGLGASRWNNVNGTTTYWATAYNATTHKYLRIGESDGRIYYDYSSDGVNWTTAVDIVNPVSVVAANAGLYAGRWGTGTNSSAKFDELAIYSPPRVGRPTVTPGAVNVALTSIPDFYDPFTVDRPEDWWNNPPYQIVSGGRVELISDPAYDGWRALKYNINLTGNAVSVAMTPNLPIGSTEEQGCGLSLAGGTGEAVAIEFGAFTSGFGSLIFREQVAGVWDDVYLNYDPVAHKYVRIREAGGLLYWETSPNGSNWVVQRSKAPAIPVTNRAVAIFAGQWGTGTGGSAFFDDFSLQVRDTASRMGLPTVTTDYNINLTGIPSSAAVGAPTVTAPLPPQVEYGSTGSASTGTGTISYTHNIAADDDYIVIYVMSGSSSTPGCTVGGTACTVLSAATLAGNFSGVNCYQSVFGLDVSSEGATPKSGNQTVSSSASSAGNIEGHTFKNVDHIGTVAAATAASGNASQTVTGLNSRDMISNGIGTGTGTWASYSQTQDYNITVSSFVRWTLLVGHARGGASVAFTATHTSGRWRSVCVPLIAA